MSAGLAIAGIAVAVIGAGVSYYGSVQTGKTQSMIANYNAHQQEKAARTQTLSLQTQAALKSQESRANFQLRAAEAAARVQNAQKIEMQAGTQDSIERVNAGKRREEFARMQATQRASIAESGVVESTGTPLDLLAETASRIQQDAEEQHYSNELQRRTLFSEAANERLGGKLALAGATLDRNSGLAQAALQDAAARGSYLAGMREAQITKLTGSAAKSAAGYAGAATLFSGASGALGSASKISFKTS